MDLESIENCSLMKVVPHNSAIDIQKWFRFNNLSQSLEQGKIHKDSQ